MASLRHALEASRGPTAAPVWIGAVGLFEARRRPAKRESHLHAIDAHAVAAHAVAED